MKDMLLFRGLGVIILITGIFEFFKFMNISLLLGIALLLTCIVSCVILFATQSFLENLEAKPVPIKDEQERRKNKDNI